MLVDMRKKPVSRKAGREGKRGFTLTEIAIVLGIIGLILGAIWVAAAAVYSNLRSSKTTTELLSMAQQIRSLYATASTIGDAAGTDESGTLCAAGIYPNDMIPAAGCPAVAAASTLIDAWSGIVTITSQTVTNAGDAFGIEFNGVPTSACITLLTANTGTGRDEGLFYASASAAAKGAAAYGAVATAFPVTAAIAAGAGVCGAGATVAVQFKFKLKG